MTMIYRPTLHCGGVQTPPLWHSQGWGYRGMYRPPHRGTAMGGGCTDRPIVAQPGVGESGDVQIPPSWHSQGWGVYRPHHQRDATDAETERLGCGGAHNRFTLGPSPLYTLGREHT